MSAKAHRREYAAPPWDPNLAKNGLKAPKVETINVERVDSQHGNEPIVHLVPPQDPIFLKWLQVRDTIVKRISLKDICMVGCFRLAKRSNPKDHRTAIVVKFTSKDPPRHLKSSECIIRSILDSFQLHEVIISFSRGIFVRGSHDSIGLVDPKVFQRPMLGQSLARNVNSQTAGTLGGFFEIKLPGSDEWKDAVLTCFHCVDQREEGLDKKAIDTLRDWRQKGVLPSDPLRSMLKIEHPSEAAIDKRISDLKNEIAVIEGRRPKHAILLSHFQKGDFDELIPQERKDMEQLWNLKLTLGEVHRFKERGLNDFGCVLAGSGLRVAQLQPTGPLNPDSYPSNLDWALIETPAHRVGINEGSSGTALYDSPVPELKHGQQLCIWGQVSGFSVGELNQLEPVVLHNQFVDGKKVRVDTIEHSITRPAKTPFAHKGDSGSLVFTNDNPSHRVLVGMLFGGVDEPRRTFSFFTPIQDIYDDIKSLTGASEVRFKLHSSARS